MGLRQVRLSLRSRPDSSQSILVTPDLVSRDEDASNFDMGIVRDVWDDAYVQLRTEPTTADIIVDYEHVLIAALRPISPEHAHGLDRNPSHWITHLDETSRSALIEALVTRGCDAFERSSYGRKMLSFVALSIDKMKSTIDNMVEICPASSTAWLAACLIVAPIIINNARKVDSHQPGINYVISRMPWYTELTKVPTVNSWKTPELHAAVNSKVVELYKLLIRYLLASARFYDHSTYRFAPNLAKWGSWETMVADIKRAEGDIQECIHTHSGKSLKRALNEGARQGEHIRSIISVFSVAQRRANLMDKIMPDAGLSNADTYQDYVTQIANPHSNTGHGVLSHATFTNWANADSGLLVLTGQPGTGKSVLTKYLLTELPRMKATSLCSFFFKEGGEHNNLNTAMYEVLNSILRQCSHLDDVEEKAQQATRHSVRPDSDLFWELVEIAGRGTPHGRVTVLLDALDECKNAHLATALKLLNDYRYKFPDSNVKFLLTARPAPDLLTLLTNGTILNLDEDTQCRESIMSDISRVAQDRVEYFARERCIRDEGTTAKLLRHLEVHENPSYLFTDLLFTYLYSLPVRPGTNYWSHTFDQLPKTVFEIYRALLDQIREGNRDDVRIMLELVLATTKPLTVREMAIALALHIDDCTMCYREDDLGLPAEDFKNWLRDTCGPFFDVYNDRIYFTHQTVRDYLLSVQQEHRPGWLKDLCIESCHKTMAESCFSYQSLPFVANNKFLTIDEYVQAPFYTKRQYHQWCQGAFVFAEHAFAKWAVHVMNSHKLEPPNISQPKPSDQDALIRQDHQIQEESSPENDYEKQQADQQSEQEEQSEQQADQQQADQQQADQQQADQQQADQQQADQQQADQQEHLAQDQIINTEERGKLPAEARPDKQIQARSEQQGDIQLLINQFSSLFSEFRADLALSLFCCSGMASSLDVKTFIDMIPTDHPARDSVLTSLSQSLMARYCHFGDAADLEYGADLAHQVLRRTKRGHPQLTQRLATFDQGLNMRFWDVVDHDVPITGNEMREADKAVTVTPTGHPRRTTVLHHRAAVLERQYQRTKDSMAISQAIDDIVSVVELIHPSKPDKPRYLDYLANLLGQRFLDGGNPADLDLAVKAAEEAVIVAETTSPDDYKLVAINRSTLASWLGARYRVTRSPNDIDRALEAIRVALDVTSSDDPSQPIYLCSHARRLYERYEETSVEEDLNEAIALSSRAVDLTPIEHPLYPFHRLFHQVLSAEELN
ncbi:hypothetical protein BDV59DRAFT_152171 [Aspergillus ambiguus]|uniref:uncharacterized protein n=1 Tax=Aspergillus ambiguus TaxID=176160 RepID=UPI003CCDCD2B